MNKKFLLLFLISGFAVMGGRADFTDFLKKKKPAPAQPRQYLTQEQIRKNQQRYLMEESSRSNGDDVEAKQRAFNDALSDLKDAVAEVGEPRVSNVVVSIMPQRSLLQKTKDFLSGKSEPKPVSIDLVTEAMQKLDAALDAHEAFLKAGKGSVDTQELNYQKNLFRSNLHHVDELQKELATLEDVPDNQQKISELNEKLKQASVELFKRAQNMLGREVKISQEAARAVASEGELAQQPSRERVPWPVKEPSKFQRVREYFRRR